MRSSLLRSLALTALAAAPLAAQASMSNTPGKAAAPAVGLRAEFMTTMATVIGKYLQLAEAIPADKYTWRPAPGVRSIAEVFLHIAAAQYEFGGAMGIAVPKGVDPSKLEASSTDKAKIIETMKAAFAYFNNGVTQMPDADADKVVKFFGTPSTMRAVLLEETGHNGEHLGQMIAYARVNGVMPPWSGKSRM